MAAGLGVLFTVNTVTGGWNLYESRKDPSGRTRKWIHTIAMLAADAGFLWTAAAAEGARESDAGADAPHAGHRLDQSRDGLHRDDVALDGLMLATLIDTLTRWCAPWQAFYADSRLTEIAVTSVHVVAMLVAAASPSRRTDSRCARRGARRPTGWRCLRNCSRCTGR
ncbi:MAG: hypothetical protein IPP98_04495 [Gemmatimonadetes bacterium]|nr:hypothetical protein [Gemmatimonadota bacterium]